MIRLVSFDAFGTLFAPRDVGGHYIAAARRVLPATALAPLLANPDPSAALLSSFLRARASLSNSHPNFGCGTIGAREWWSRAIFRAFAGTGVEVPGEAHEAIVDALFTSFARDPSAYSVFPDTLPAISALALMNPRPVLACTSNMDPRLADILGTLGIQLDLICPSYELGVEKPDPRLFEKVRQKAEAMLAARNAGSTALEPHECVHIGDDRRKDYEGAKAGGWKALLLNRKEGELDGPESADTVPSLRDLVSFVARANGHVDRIAGIY